MISSPVDGLEQLALLVESVLTADATGVGFGGLSNGELVQTLETFERLRNRLELIDQRLVAAVDRSSVPEDLNQRDTAAVLSARLRISRRQASERVRAARCLGTRRSFTGAVLPPVHPALATVVETGRVGAEVRSAALGCLRTVTTLGADADTLGRCDVSLAEHAAVLGPVDFRQVCDKLVDCEFPDGTLSDDQVHTMRAVRMTAKRDGSYALAGDLTGSCGAKLVTVLDSLSKPLASTPEGTDPRSAEQRSHDALETVCDRLLRGDELPDSGGMPASVIVWIGWGELLGRRGQGRTTDGQRVSAETVSRLLDEAEILPTVVDEHGVVLWQGRLKRTATDGQTKALVARDQHCSFPGCQVKPEWCQRHHVVPWRDGGVTDVDNLTLLCGYHHRHFEQRGWECRMVDRRPVWVPPRWVDPERTPLPSWHPTASSTGRAEAAVTEPDDIWWIEDDVVDVVRPPDGTDPIRPAEPPLLAVRLPAPVRGAVVGAGGARPA